MSPRRAAVLRHHPPHASPTLREHLLDTTERLFDHEAMATLTTRRIAREAGVSDGVLYNHFADKSALVLAALLRRSARLIERFEASAPVAGVGSVLDNVLAYARSLAALESDALFLGAGLLADPPLLRRFWTELHRAPFGPHRLRAPLLAYLDAEQAAGRVHADADLDAVVTLVFGACGIVALTRRLNPSVPRRAIDRQLTAAVTALSVVLEPAPTS